jgi:acylphosphatase
MENNRSTALITVKGRVQGVFYRQSTLDKARSLGLVGWVRNQNDGSVALQATGPREVITALIAWCHQGPPSARVDEVEVKWLDEPAEYGKFDIVR